MKSCLCLLLIAFITCQSLDKNNEIVLKASDIVNEAFEKIAEFCIDCDLNEDCVYDKLNEYLDTLTYDEVMTIENFTFYDECKDFCIEKLSKKVDKEASEKFCSEDFCFL